MARDKIFMIRLSQEEKEAIEKAAKQADRKTVDWIRHVILSALKKLGV